MANAPALFQELMNKILSILRQRPVVQELISRGAQMEAHIDEFMPGNEYPRGPPSPLGRVLCGLTRNPTRTKLEKCEIMQETMQYLGFDIGYRWWTTAASEAKPLMTLSYDMKTPRKNNMMYAVSLGLTTSTAAA